MNHLPDALRRYDAARRSGDPLALAAAAHALAEHCRDRATPWHLRAGVRGPAFALGLFAAAAGWVAFLARLPLDALPWLALCAAGVALALWGWQGWPDTRDAP